jgi:hypothetical protein
LIAEYAAGRGGKSVTSVVDSVFMKHEELTGQMIGAAMVVLNELRPGLDEKLYKVETSGARKARRRN